MADISKEDLKKEITAILKDADLTTMSAKKVRQQIEEKLEIDLTSRKKEVDDIVMQCLKDGGKKGGAAKKNGASSLKKDEEDDDEEVDGEEEDDIEEDEDEEEEKPKRAAPKKQAPKRKKGSSEEDEPTEEEKGSDEEYSPAKKSKGRSPAKAAGRGATKGGRKKKGTDSDSDEDWGKGRKGAGKKKGGGGKRGGGGFTKVCTLTPELAAVVGQDTMARHEVVKKVWSIIKEKNLYDPKNKQFAICDDDLLKVIGTKRFRTFGMMKYLKKHFVD